MEESKSSPTLANQKSSKAQSQTEQRKSSDESLEVVSFVTDPQRQKSFAEGDDDEFVDLNDDDELVGLGDEMVAKEDHVQTRMGSARKPKLMMKIAQSVQSVYKITDYEQRLSKA